jgi:hypothetical protein
MIYQKNLKITNIQLLMILNNSQNHQPKIANIQIKGLQNTHQPKIMMIQILSKTIIKLGKPREVF